MPLSSSNAVRQLSDGNSQGTVLGQSSSDPIGFYNVTPVTRVAVVGSTLTAQAGVISTAPQSAGGAVTTWAFTSSSQAQMVVSTMIALWNLGIIG